jgi:phosphate transport system protein
MTKRVGQMPQSTSKDKRQQLQDELLALGSLVEDLLIGSVDLLEWSDLDALERIGEDSRQIHKKRLSIEMGCLGLIAVRRPLDGELRPLVAMVEIAAELERIADHAQRVARANYLTADHRLRTSLSSLQRLAGDVQSLLDGALDTFSQSDAGAARTVAAGTREIENLYQQVRHELMAVMRSNPRIANQAIFLSRSAYNLRRAAERVAGICEWVGFAVEGSLAAGQPAPEFPAHPAEETSKTQ